MRVLWEASSSSDRPILARDRRHRGILLRCVSLAARFPRSRRAGCSVLDRVKRCFRRQHHEDPQACGLCRAHFDAAAVPLDDLLRDRQPEAEAGVVFAPRIIDFEKRLEHLVAKGGRDARAVVGNLDLDGIVRVGAERHAHRAAVLDRILHNVGNGA